MLRQILEEANEYNINPLPIVYRFEDPYERINNDQLYKAMMDLNIISWTLKVIRLMTVTIREMHSRLKIDVGSDDLFDCNTSLRQVDGLSCLHSSTKYLRKS